MTKRYPTVHPLKGLGTSQGWNRVVGSTCGRRKRVWAGWAPWAPFPTAPPARASAPFDLEGRIRTESCGFPRWEGRGWGLGEGPGHSPGVRPASPWLLSIQGILQLQGLIQLPEHVVAFKATDLCQGRGGRENREGKAQRAFPVGLR